MMEEPPVVNINNKNNNDDNSTKLTQMSTLWREGLRRKEKKKGMVATDRNQPNNSGLHL